MKLINEINNQNLGYKLGINNFSDITPEEFKKTYLNGIIEAQPIKVKSTIQSKSNEIKPIDHSIYMTAARDQGECGVCWAFAGLGAVEANFNILKNILDPKNKFNLSPQQLIDCRNANACEAEDNYLAFRK